MIRLPASSADRPTKIGARFRDERLFDPMQPLNEEEEMFKLEKLRLTSKMGMLRGLYYWREEDAAKDYPEYPKLLEREAASLLEDYVRLNPLGIAVPAKADRRTHLGDFYGNLARWKASIVVALRIMNDNKDRFPGPLPKSPEEVR